MMQGGNLDYGWGLHGILHMGWSPAQCYTAMDSQHLKGPKTVYAFLFL